jgi:SAM-dependent methyltransferase
LKQGEINYLQALGVEGRAHAVGKPFSDPQCGRYLVALGQIMQLLPPPPARLLDLGCGTGWTSRMLAKSGYDVVGCDIAPEMIDCADEIKWREAVASVSFCTKDYEELDFDSEFDAVIFFDALHHAEDEVLALTAAYCALRPGGVCVISEPGEGHSTTPESIRAMQEFGVTEKDMPPHHVVAIGQKLGFRASVHPHLSQLIVTQAESVARPYRRRLLHRLPFVPRIKLLFLSVLIFVSWKWRNGVVVLVKPS